MKTQKFLKRRTWLEARSKYVGASDSPILFGQGYAGHNAQTLYASKVVPAEVDDQSQDEAPDHLILGNCLEDGIIRAARTRPECKGLEIIANRVGEEGRLVYFDDAREYVGFTPDAMVHPRNPVEVKNISHWNKDDWADEATPMIYQIQMQHQLLVTGAQWGLLIACLAGQALVIRKIQRNDKFLETLSKRIDGFWHAVTHKQMPPIDGTESTKKALATLYPVADGFAVEMPTEATQWLTVREAAKKLGKYCDAMATEAENRIKACLQEAVAGILPDGRVVKWGTVNVKAKHCPHCESVLKDASSYRKLTTPKKLPAGLDVCPCSTDLVRMTGGQMALEFQPMLHLDSEDE